MCGGDISYDMQILLADNWTKSDLKIPLPLLNTSINIYSEKQLKDIKILLTI